MVVLRGIAIDNGGSECRSLAVGNSEVHCMKSDFVTVEEKDFRVKEVEDPFEAVRVVQAPSDEYLGIVARGAAGRLYSAKMMGFDNQSTKTGAVNYYRQFVYALACDAMRAVRSGDGCKMDDIFDYVIATCIPVKEHSGKNDCATVLRSRLGGRYVVEFPFMVNESVTFCVEPSHIGVVPEGGVALTALRGDIGEDELSLIVDMGQVTTDIALYKGKTLYGDKVISSPAAGGTLNALIRAAMIDEGYTLNESQVLKVLETGHVRQGASQVDAADIVQEQKAAFVRNFLKKEIMQILNMNGINALQIQNLIPIGAAMNDPGKDGSIVREIVMNCGLTSAAVRCLSEDLRYVNVEQTAVFAKALYKQVLKAKQ